MIGISNPIIETINQGEVLGISTKGHKMNNHRTGMGLDLIPSDLILGQFWLADLHRALSS